MLIYPVTSHLSNTSSMEGYKDAVWAREANRHIWKMYLHVNQSSFVVLMEPMIGSLLLQKISLEKIGLCKNKCIRLQNFNSFDGSLVFRDYKACTFEAN